jgi:multicomponent Na+:H+ antiporter subunit E
MARTRSPARPPVAAARFLAHLAVLAGLWWLIVQGRSDAWLIGIPVILFATLVSIRLSGPAMPRISPLGLLGFLLVFLRESFAGGVDVARRTLGRRMRIQPGFRSYRIRLQDRAARVLLVNCISLLPGTLASMLEGDRLEVHMLDERDNPESQLVRLEQVVARLFGLPREGTDV